jgi:pimeloyl-ACP methyl ester carboxylesterase
MKKIILTLGVLLIGMISFCQSNLDSLGFEENYIRPDLPNNPDSMYYVETFADDTVGYTRPLHWQVQSGAFAVANDATHGKYLKCTSSGVIKVHLGVIGDDLTQPLSYNYYDGSSWESVIGSLDSLIENKSYLNINNAYLILNIEQNDGVSEIKCGKGLVGFNYPSISYNDGLIFNADFRTGRYIDWSSGDSLLPIDGGLDIVNQEYGLSLESNNVGYLNTDSIYNLNTGNWTFEWAVKHTGIDDGAFFSQFNTTTGYDFSKRVTSQEVQNYVRNPNTKLNDGFFYYQKDSTQHLVVTKDSYDTVRTYVNNVFFDAKKVTCNLTTDVPLYIASRLGGSDLDSTYIYYIKIYEESKNAAWVNNSYSNFYSNYYEAKIYVPSAYDGSESEIALYFHGNGGDYEQDPPTSWLDSLLAENIIVAQTSGTNNWGNQEGQDAYTDLYDYVKTKYNVDDSCVILTNSMGTLAALNLLRDDNIKCKAAIFTNPVFDLDTLYYRDDDFFTSGIRAAYNFSTDGEYAAATNGYNCNEGFTGDNYSQLPPVYFLSGDNDTIAPYSNIYSFYDKLNNQTGQDASITTVVGGTHSSSISTPANIGIIMDWLRVYLE